ncbi:uncharacterized protein ASCRUDRAFT_9015 [Ascoidea rubescens DSM 1968]|uniref:Uncharacterized protein n=1 Tax=Ascoidea rubescens DSM 1968 TaxID=1344418 RepID=A0A1D2VDS9_9ASCO|nr:hypothetical protein ASCRUDRAFT_9015 [Ascoidea rubescens DSM 1968]ODV59786.1 hypothetical protein ASCRUDRAFT_9015 [Ascoidea rubescens DSM 1968]
MRLIEWRSKKLRTKNIININNIHDNINNNINDNINDNNNNNNNNNNNKSENKNSNMEYNIKFDNNNKYYLRKYPFFTINYLLPQSYYMNYSSPFLL